MINAYEAITGFPGSLDRNLFARPEDAALLIGVLKYLVTSGGTTPIPPKYIFQVKVRVIFGAISVAPMTDIPSILNDWVLHVAPESIPEGAESATWPDGMGLDPSIVGQPVFTPDQVTRIIEGRAIAKIRAVTLSEAERHALSTSQQTLNSVIG